MAVEPITVLDRATSHDAASEPYAYAVVRDALPPEIYARLSAEFPTLADIDPGKAKASNKRLNLVSSWGPAELPAEKMPESWRTFVQSHLTAAFTRQVFDLFPQVTQGTGDQRRIRLDDFGPALPSRLGLEPTVAEQDIAVRVTLGANTPVLKATSVRGPHVDSPRKAFVGLYYLRDEADDSEGGNLVIYRKADGAEVEPWVQKSDGAGMEPVAEIPYAANTLVVMLNTHDALHGVSVRQPTPHVRRFAIISGWFPGVDRADTSPDSLARL